MSQQGEKQHFSQFVTEDFEAYIKRKRADHSFANHLEMQANATRRRMNAMRSTPRAADKHALHERCD
jgi:hypothetical protein